MASRLLPVLQAYKFTILLVTLLAMAILGPFIEGLDFHVVAVDLLFCFVVAAGVLAVSQGRSSTVAAVENPLIGMSEEQMSD